MSNVTRAGTLQSQSYIMGQIGRNTAQYVDLQQQITTGQKTQRFSGMANEAAQTINLSNNYDSLNQFVKSGDTASSRLSGVNNSIETVLDVATRFRAQLMQAMTSDQAAAGRIDLVADGALQEVSGALNVDLGGVYLFGGVKSDTPPVDLTDPIKNSAGTFYSGADELMQTRIDSNTVLSYGTTANRQGFKDIVAALQRVTSGSASLSELETALDEMNSAISDITQLQAEVGHQMKVVETAKSRNDATKATVETQLGNLRDVDVSAAMVQLTQRETILQASYVMISKQNNLSLANYLN